MQLAPDLSANRNARHDVFWRFVHLIFTSVQRSLTSAAYGLQMPLCAAPQPTPRPRYTSDTKCYGVSSTLSSLSFSVPSLLGSTTSPYACVRLLCGSLVRLVLVSSVSLWWADRAALSGSGSSLRHLALRVWRCYALPRHCLLWIAS